jgi:hypothetical protein
MTMMFQVSDLAGARRREFLDEAKRGEASLRDTDGAVLVMVAARRLAALSEASTVAVQMYAAEAALKSPERIVPASLGQLAWLAEFDEDDRLEALAELRDAVSLTLVHQDPAPLRDVLRAWRTTAAVMRDPVRRAVLTSAPSDDDFVEVQEPVDG